LKTLGIITTGGDAPGMNAAIRAVVRIADLRNLKIIGFENGWKGLIQDTSRQLTPRSVGGILQTGGTILHTSRCIEFRKKELIKRAAGTLASNNVDGLIVIGGNGSFKGVLDLSKQTDTL
jgi:6-phosphofructokinase 1